MSAFARQHLDAVNGRTHGNIADGQRVACLDGRFGAAKQRGARLDTARSDDVATLAIGITKQGDMRGAVGVVLDTLDLGRHAIFVAAEINHAVVVLVATTFVPHRDVAVVVAASLLDLRLEQ